MDVWGDYRCLVHILFTPARVCSKYSRYFFSSFFTPLYWDELPLIQFAINVKISEYLAHACMRALTCITRYMWSSSSGFIFDTKTCWCVFEDASLVKQSSSSPESYKHSPVKKTQKNNQTLISLYIQKNITPLIWFFLCEINVLSRLLGFPPDVFFIFSFFLSGAANNNSNNNNIKWTKVFIENLGKFNNCCSVTFGYSSNSSDAAQSFLII